MGWYEALCQKGCVFAPRVDEPLAVCSTSRILPAGAIVVTAKMKPARRSFDGGYPSLGAQRQVASSLPISTVVRTP